MASSTLAPAERAALDALTADLRRIFGNRLLSISSYGPAADEGVRSIVLVDRLAFDDLAACVHLVREWDARGLAVPLILERHEFVRSLDVFPLEYGEIIDTHVPVYGDDPFEGVEVPETDRRRACELQAKSHLIHLREGFLESRGEPRAVAALIGASADGYRRLLLNLLKLVAPRGMHPDADVAEVAELHLEIDAELTREVLATAGRGPSTIADPTALLAAYIATVERLWECVDAWKRS